MRITIISIVPILHYVYLNRTTLPSCRSCRRFFQHAGTLENHVEREHPPFFRASPIDRQADSSLDLEPSDTETSNFYFYLIHATNQSRHPQGICGKATLTKGKGLLPALGRSATTNEIPRPPRCAVRRTRGQEYPHTTNKRKD